jgi:hypothetical protein
MKSKAEIEQEVQKTLDCFEQKPSIAWNPFFATRVMFRVRELDEHQRVPALRRVFSLATLRPALLALIVVVNIVSAIYVWRGNQPQTDTRAQALSAFADEYTWNQQEYDVFLSTK